LPVNISWKTTPKEKISLRREGEKIEWQAPPLRLFVGATDNV
jgi:hypothetical protein